LLQY